MTASACPAGRRSAGRELGAGTGSRDNSAAGAAAGSCSCGHSPDTSGAEDSAQCTGVTSLGPGAHTAERSDRSFLVAFQNYKFNCATENSKLLLSVFVTESVVMAGILNTTFVHSTHSAT